MNQLKKVQLALSYLNLTGHVITNWCNRVQFITLTSGEKSINLYLSDAPYNMSVDEIAEDIYNQAPKSYLKEVK